MLLLSTASKPALKTVGLPAGSTPVMPLKASMWSKALFSSISTKTCWIFAGAGLPRPRPLRLASSLRRASRAHRSVSQATQTSSSAQENTTQTVFTTQAKAMHTHFASQYQAWQTQFATQ